MIIKKHFQLIKKKQNFLDKHNALIKKGSQQLLTHPLMRLFISLKWQPHKIRYQINFFIFLVFVLIFSMHGIFCIDFLQCEDGKEGELVKEKKTSRKFILNIILEPGFQIATLLYLSSIEFDEENHDFRLNCDNFSRVPGRPCQIEYIIV